MIEVNTPTDGGSGQYSALAGIMRRRRSVLNQKSPIVQKQVLDINNWDRET